MKQILVVALSLLGVRGYAQSPVSARLSSGFDVGMAYATQHANPSVVYYQLIQVGQRRLLALGWTARLGAFYGSDLDYYTAPARLTRNKTGLESLTGPIVADNIDTVRFDYLTSTSFNVGIRAQLNLGPVELGVSADLLGLTFGRWRTGSYRSSNGTYTVTGGSGQDSTLAFQGANLAQRAYPTRFNARLLGDNDHGTLTTEVYARLHLGQRVALKAGYQWLTSEVSAQHTNTLTDNNRFRHRAGLAYVALSFPVF